MINHYEVLGLAPTASQEDIKAAYRRLVHKFHPDRNNGDRASAQRFIVVKEAYDILSDPASKSRFDTDLREYYEKKYANYQSQGSTNSNSDSKTNTSTTHKEDVYSRQNRRPYQASPPSRNNNEKDDVWGCLFIVVMIFAVSFIFKACGDSESSTQNNRTNSELHDEFVASNDTDSSDKSNETTEGQTSYTIYQPIEQIVPQYVKDSIRYVQDGYRVTRVGNGKKPDCYNFNPEHDYEMDNKLIVHVGGGTDVAIKVMDISTDICVRYFYINSGTTYTVRNFPEGRYYLKIAYGKTWMTNIENGQCKGKFLHNKSYEKGENILDFRKQYYDDYISYPSYELKLDMVITGHRNSFNTDEIDSEEFNK